MILDKILLMLSLSLEIGQMQASVFRLFGLCIVLLATPRRLVWSLCPAPVLLTHWCQISKSVNVFCSVMCKMSIHREREVAHQIEMRRLLKKQAMQTERTNCPLPPFASQLNLQRWFDMGAVSELNQKSCISRWSFVGHIVWSICLRIRQWSQRRQVAFWCQSSHHSSE